MKINDNNKIVEYCMGQVEQNDSVTFVMGEEVANELFRAILNTIENPTKAEISYTKCDIGKDAYIVSYSKEKAYGVEILILEPLYIVDKYTEEVVSKRLEDDVIIIGESVLTEEVLENAEGFIKVSIVSECEDGVLEISLVNEDEVCECEECNCEDCNCQCECGEDCDCCNCNCGEVEDCIDDIVEEYIETMIDAYMIDEKDTLEDLCKKIYATAYEDGRQTALLGLHEQIEREIM